MSRWVERGIWAGAGLAGGLVLGSLACMKAAAAPGGVAPTPEPGTPPPAEGVVLFDAPFRREDEINLPVRIFPPGVSAPSRDLEAVVDTGAYRTVFPDPLCQSLGLPQVGESLVTGVTGHYVTARVYAADVGIGAMRWTVEVVGVGDTVLIGMDLIRKWRVWIDGAARRIRIVVP